jgi:ABC-type nitrate/sulfonate/bicarbonate transport system substrate-binding protein
MAPKESSARAPMQLRVSVFNGAWNLPIWAAQTRGFFEAVNLDVQVLLTKSSGALMQSLYAGDVEIALAGADNFLAYEEGLGEVEVEKDDELRLVLGGDNGFLKLVARAPYQRVAQLRGKSIGVDALTTGFAFVVRETLRRNAVHETSVNWLPIGGTETRYAALLDQRCDATLLRLPYDLLAQVAGASILAGGEELGPYQGTVGAVRKRWAEERHEQLVAFIRGYARGLRWCVEPTNRPAAITELQTRLSVADEVLAAAVLDELVAPGGLQIDMQVDRAGLATVIELRERYGAGQRPMRDPDRYVDETYLRSAGALATA